MKQNGENSQDNISECEFLRVAILRQAVYDYKKAIRARNIYRMAYLEKFFLSDWGQLLSKDQGQQIIKECKRIVNN